MVAPGRILGLCVEHNWVDVILIGWVLISALVTPLVGRFLNGKFSDPAEDAPEHDPIRVKAPHDTADA